MGTVDNGGTREVGAAWSAIDRSGLGWIAAVLLSSGAGGETRIEWAGSNEDSDWLSDLRKKLVGPLEGAVCGSLTR